MSMGQWDIIELTDDVPSHIQEHQHAVIKDKVFQALCQMARSNGIALVSSIHQKGLGEVAESILGEGDSAKYHSEAEFRFEVIEQVYTAVYELSSENLIEWVNFAGGPAVYVPDAAMYAEGREAYRERLSELRSMPYKEYLRTPEWIDRRDRHREHAGGRCQLCYSSGLLHVHHRTYERRGCERFSDLIVLCSDCHKMFHEHSELNPIGRGHK